MNTDFKEAKIEVYIPEEYVVRLREELNKANACKIGNYDNTISFSKVKGYWRPLEGSNPFNGEIGSICEGEECKVEFRCKKEYIRNAIKVIKEIHPYEEPVYNIIPVINEMFEQDLL